MLKKNIFFHREPPVISILRVFDIIKMASPLLPCLEVRCHSIARGKGGYNPQNQQMCEGKRGNVSAKCEMEDGYMAEDARRCKKLSGFWGNGAYIQKILDIICIT